jgi:hypothetical protein
MHLVVIGRGRFGGGGRRLRPPSLDLERLQGCCWNDPVCTVSRGAFVAWEGWRPSAFPNFTVTDGKIPSGRHTIV